MAVVYANASNIHIEDSPVGFAATVTTALDRLWSEDTGQRLLNGIQNSGAPPSGFLDNAIVLIKWPTIRDASTTEKRARTADEFGNRAVAANEVRAKGGGGCGSVVFYNPTTVTIPGQGDRPPFIGMAHELVHAWHNAMGTKKGSYDAEESYTVGLGQWASPDPTCITENRIRLDYGLAIRHKYN